MRQILQLVSPISYLGWKDIALFSLRFKCASLFTVGDGKNGSVEDVDGDCGRLGRRGLAGVEAGVAELDAADDEAGNEATVAVAEQEVAFRGLRALEQDDLENTDIMNSLPRQHGWGY